MGGRTSAREPEDIELRKRLDRLSHSLEQGKSVPAQKADRPDGGENSGNVAIAFQLASEFVAAVLVGGLIGWGIDKLAGTLPLFLIIFLLAGFAAALTNMVRVSKAARAKTPVGNDLPSKDMYDDEDR